MDYSKIKAIFYYFDKMSVDDILWGLLEMGIDVALGSLKAEINYIVDEQVESIKNEIQEYDYVITQNFSTNVALACHEKEKKYISWIYDSPQVALYTDHALYDTNFVFAFDKKQVERLKEIGLKHVFYQPLATNIAKIEHMQIPRSDYSKYNADVSFVGQLYQKDYFDEFVSKLPEAVGREILDICNQKALSWGKGSNIFNSVSDESVPIICKDMNQSDFVYFHMMDHKYSAEVLLSGPYISQIDRIRVLERTAEKFKACLYTRESDLEIASKISGLKVCGPVKGEETYKVYYASKLNLNLTMRTIETGVPQRVFDIMGVGGAVISNRQDEMEELFVPDKEIILFESEEEYLDKVSFYLYNDKARRKIAENGKKRVEREYNYLYSLKSIFENVDAE